jgi:hypothetical protein
MRFNLFLFASTAYGFMDYIQSTGVCAGKIYGQLSGMEAGCAKLADVKKKINDKCFDYAIGWLLREGKVELQTQGKSTIVKLL